MVSDVLAEAVAAIKKYQREMPDVYGKQRARIDAVVQQMDALRQILDTPPPSLRVVP